MFIRSYLLLAAFAACGLAAKNDTLANHELDGNLNFVVYKGDPQDGALYFNGTMDEYEAARPRRNEFQYGCGDTGGRKWSKVKMSQFKIKQNWEMWDGINCILLLKRFIWEHCEPKYFTFNVNSCYCMYRFAPKISGGGPNAEGYTRNMIDTVAGPNFKGSVTFEHDIGGKHMMASAVECSGSDAGLAKFNKRWNKGKSVKDYEKQWKVDFDYGYMD
ncbi:hypothetical protein BGX28_005848 [Mortierella sp. GBA30]|nr:hypothetical protein BGX28_005848 [Mortierella sp. GBA30]